MRRPVRLALFAGLAVLAAFAIADALGLRTSSTGVVSPLGYVEISHGGHNHYVPNDWSGDPAISAFPTSPPPDGMTVGPTGEIVAAP